MNAATCNLLIGCGYLGRRLLPLLLEQGMHVHATTRRSNLDVFNSAARLSHQKFDIHDSSDQIIPPAARDFRHCDVYFLLTPSSLSAALESGGGFGRLLDVLEQWAPRRACLVSSTAAFGNRSGDIVTAETPPTPDSLRARRLIDIESRWCARGSAFQICRMAGLYGPNRIPGLNRVRDGDILPGPSTNWLNLIHVEDAARLLAACTRSPNSARVELGADTCPVRRSEYYAYLAARIGAPAPRFDLHLREHLASRRCDPTSTIERTGWNPKFSDYRTGLDASGIGS